MEVTTTGGTKTPTQAHTHVEPLSPTMTPPCDAAKASNTPTAPPAKLMGQAQALQPVKSKAVAQSSTTAVAAHMPFDNKMTWTTAMAATEDTAGGLAAKAAMSSPDGKAERTCGGPNGGTMGTRRGGATGIVKRSESGRPNGIGNVGETGAEGRVEMPHGTGVGSRGALGTVGGPLIGRTGAGVMVIT